MRIAMRKPLPSAHRYFTLTFVLWLATLLPLCAQNFSGHNWYFGNSNLGIRFSRSSNLPTLLSNKASLGTGGSAVATDPVNGNLLFYSDGTTIFDVTHSAMPNGTGLNGVPAGNQPVALAKVPGTTSEYYVFTNTANGITPGSISYTIVDMEAFGNATFPAPATGDVNPANKNVAILGLTNRSEAMIVIPHTNERDFWLITHESGAAVYTVTLFDNSGTVPASTNDVALGFIDLAANFSYHPLSGRIAVSPQGVNRNIEILNFNATTGALSPNLRINSSAVTTATTQAIYDTEWSNNGQYLYISRHGDAGVPADVLQFDFSDLNATLTSVLPQPNSVFRSYGLQMAPDSLIYHLYQATNGGPFLAGTLGNTDTIFSEVIYDASAFNSDPDFNGRQFPSFAAKDEIVFTVDFTTEGTCSNSPISFYPIVVPSADSLRWSFGDGQFATEWSPVHTYEQGGAFQVEVFAFLNGDTAYATHPLNLTQFDLQLQLVQDTTACMCELPVNLDACNGDITQFEVSVQAQGGTPQYQWFGPGGLLAGQNTETLRPDSAGYYYVVGTMGACSAYAGVNIKEYDSLDQRANIWYFGNNAGIDFNPLPDNPAVAITGPLVTPAGTSVISDRNGQVIFSTDGFSVYNKLNQDITPAGPPPGIGGANPAAQSALIIPVPGDETLYYIFTTQDVYGTGTFELRYSLFDLKLNNGLGGLAEYNQLLFAPSTERITGNANWLIAHEYGNNSFRAYRISTTGISNPIISDIGSDHAMSTEQNAEGYMKLGAQNRLAVALSTPGVSNVVEIFDFVDSSGAVTNFRTANLNNAAGEVYGVELSPAGNKLFATLKDAATSTLYEFAFDTLGNPYFKQSVPQAGELGAIQIAPDGQLYVAINGSGTLGMFAAQEDTTQLSNITTLQTFDLAGNTSTLGLPNFIQTIANPTTTPSFSFTGLCLGDSTQFNAVGKDPAIDKFDWNFGDGQVAIDSGAQVSHLYAAPGTYTVVLTIRNKCETPVATYIQDVTINDVPPDPSTAVVLCTGAAQLDANPQDLPDFTYVWSTGDITEIITVNQQAMYNVTITDALGCTTDGTFLAADNRPQVELGANSTICEDTAVPPLDALNRGATYAWELNGAPSGTAKTHAVNTAVFGLFEYKVEVTDTVTTCFVRDSVTFTINESPNITVPVPGDIACNTQTGQISVNFNSPLGTLFSYFISGPTVVTPGGDQAPGSVFTTTPTLAAGSYGITVTDQVTGCAAITTASINNNTFTVGPVTAVPPLCDPIRLSVDLVAAPGPIDFPVAYRVINNTTAIEVESGVAPGPGANFLTDIAGLPSNNQEYVVEVRAADNCVATSAPVTIIQNPRVPVTLTQDPCAEPVTITATGGDTWLWSGPGTIADPAAPTLSVTGLSQGSHTFNLTVTGAVFCNRDTTVTVNVNNNIAATFTQTDRCADQVILTADPAGPYTYRWFRNGALIPGGRTIIAALADNGLLYSVDVVNTVTGCIFSSPATVVNVSGELDFVLTATPPCEGQPFTLTATANQASVTYEWKRDGTVLSGETSATLVETRGGLYDVSVTSAGGACSVTQTFNVVPSPVTPGNLPGSGIICPDPANPDPLTREVTLDPGAEFISYNWFRDGSPLSGEDEQTFIASEAGVYSVDLINIYGCPSSDETLLIEDCSPRITGPNAFRPTSDVQGGGEYSNRNFKLFTFFIHDDDFEVFIFTRWGEMVYHTTERDFRWNGGYNNSSGQPLPTGTYTYVVRYRSSYRPEEGVKEKRGGVVLLR